VRLFAVGALVLFCAACGHPPEPAPAASTPAPVNLTVNPGRIDRARAALPDGYEVAGYTGNPTPISLWGLRDAAVSEPPQCAALAAPAVDAATAKGWSASGPGGIVYAVVARAATPAPDAALLADCGRWTVRAGHTSGAVTDRPGPDITAAHTVGMTATTMTSVEGGTETHSRADTFVAHLGQYVCFVTLVTDPGSSSPALQPSFASHLLTETVSVLRG
jgi:hypothetical protein